MSNWKRAPWDQTIKSVTRSVWQRLETGKSLSIVKKIKAVNQKEI